MSGGRDVGATGVFSRVVDGRELSFEADGDAFVDQQTGSRWNVFGEATEGELSGTQLAAVPHVDTFWFAWTAFLLTPPSSVEHSRLCQQMRILTPEASRISRPPQAPPWHLALAAAAGYSVGLLPSAASAARIASGGLDLRVAGTGNPGGANAAAVLGRRWGYAVMAADIAKGAVACRIGRGVAGDAGRHVAGVAAVAGHCYPVTHWFRGGKGVATSVGQCLATLPACLPIHLAVATVVAAGPWKRRAFPATMAASTTWVAASVLWWRRQLPNAWGGAPTAGHALAAAASSALIATRFFAGRST